MSLKDTIDAARREAQEAGSIFVAKEKEPAQDEEPAGFSRRSAARAKPTSEAAASVRVVSASDAKAGKSGKKANEMSKEERKAERSRQRDVDDRRSMAANILLKRDEAYARTQRVWWVALGTGFALTLVSFGINWMINKNEAYATTTVAMVAMVSLALAYVCIIGAFIYDLVKARPIRKRVDAEVQGMTMKKVDQLIADDAREKAAKKK